MTTLVKVGGGSTSQSDYAQNDSTKADYIKNRPCYSESTSVEHEECVFSVSAENTLVEGFAPDLSERVGETVTVPTYMTEPGGTEWQLLGNLECTISEIEAGQIGIVFPEVEGMAIGTLLIKYNYETQSADEYNSTFMLNPFVVQYGVSMKFEIPIPYTQIETVYHTLDKNYIEDGVREIVSEIDNDEGIYIEKVFEAVPWVNQPDLPSGKTVEDAFYRYWQNYKNYRYYIYIPQGGDAGDFMIVDSLWELIDKRWNSYVPTSDDWVFHINPVDDNTGLGYNIYTGLDISISAGRDSEGEPYFTVCGYDCRESTDGMSYQAESPYTINIPNKLYEYIDVDVSYVLDIGFDIESNPDKATLSGIEGIEITVPVVDDSYGNTDNYGTDVSGIGTSSDEIVFIEIGRAHV